jgi:hypothetical protein
MALGWNLASVVNDPLEAPGSTLLYLCLLPAWGAVGGHLLDPKYSCDHKLLAVVKKPGSQDLKTGLLSQEILTRNTSAGAGSSSAPLRGADADSEHAVEISAKGRDKPV